MKILTDSSSFIFKQLCVNFMPVKVKVSRRTALEGVVPFKCKNYDSASNEKEGCRWCINQREEEWNQDRDRHYGFCMGDIVTKRDPIFENGEYKGTGYRGVFEVIGYPGDNNSVKVIDPNGQIEKQVAETCKLLCKVEDRTNNDSLNDYIDCWDLAFFIELSKPII